MKVKIKVGNISQFHEARYCAGMGVDWIGFDNITSESFAEMTSWLVGPQFAIEVEALPAALIPDTIMEVPASEITKVQGNFSVRLHLKEWEKYKGEISAGKNAIQYVQVQLSDDKVENEKALKELSSIVKVYVLVENIERLDDYLSLQTEGIALAGGMQEDYSPVSSVLEQLQMKSEK